MSSPAPAMQPALASRIAHAAPGITLLMGLWWLFAVVVVAVAGAITTFQEGVPPHVIPLVVVVSGAVLGMMVVEKRHDAARCRICTTRSAADTARQVRIRARVFTLHHWVRRYCVPIMLLAVAVVAVLFLGGVYSTIANAILHMLVTGGFILTYADSSHELYRTHCPQCIASRPGTA